MQQKQQQQQQQQQQQGPSAKAQLVASIDTLLDGEKAETRNNVAYAVTKMDADTCDSILLMPEARRRAVLLHHAREQASKQPGAAGQHPTGAAAGLLSAKEYIMQRLACMPQRTSDRASSSMTQPCHARTFAAIEEMPGFADRVHRFVDGLPDSPKKYNRLVYRATATLGEEPEVMLSGAADESYVRACMIRALEGVSEVAADLGLDTEYVDGGSGRSLSFTDMLVRKRGTSVYKDPSRLVLGVVEVKGSWQLKLDGSTSLHDALAHEELGPSVAKVIQQAYGDAVTDEAPLMMVSNWHVTFLLSRSLDDVRDKTLQASQWAWDSTDVHPLGAFLFVLHMAHQMWHTSVKQQLPRNEVPGTPPAGYEVQLGSRQMQLGVGFNGLRPVPSRSQPPRRSSIAQQPCHPDSDKVADAEELCSDTSSLLLPNYSSSSSSSLISNSRHNRSSDGSAGEFDAMAWTTLALNFGLSSAAVAVEALPMLPSSAVCSSTCLSSSSNRRVFKGCNEGAPAAFKAFNVKDPHAMSAFVAEALAYLQLKDMQGQCVPSLLALGRMLHSGVPVLVLSLCEPMSMQLLQQHASAAQSCLRHLHAAGFAHGDVRLSNFLHIAGQVAVCDLETCSAADEQACEQDLERLSFLLHDSGQAA